MASKIKLNREHINKIELEQLDRKERYHTLRSYGPLSGTCAWVDYYPCWLALSICRLLGVMKLYLWKIMREFGIAKPISEYFKTTFQISILTTLICVLLGYPLTYFMSQLSNRWANICMIGVLIPFWTSLLVRTYAWLVLLQKKGLINSLAVDWGLWSEPIKFVHNTSGTLIGMVHIMLPFLILPLYANMRTIDKDCLKAAANLGATPTRAFWTVFFPLSLPGLFAGLLIVFVLCLGFYVTPALLGGGKVIMAAMKISDNIELYFSWGAASALGVVLLVVTMIILFIASKLVSIDQLGNRS